MEPFYDQYKDTLEELNKCVRTFDIRLCGNLFYARNDISKMVELFLEKRKDFCDLAMNSDCIVEIGFNAGHSALLGLTANNDLFYRSVDIGSYVYTDPCYQILKDKFGDRIKLTIGDSLDVVPRIKEIYPEIEGQKVGWFIDGNHTYNHCKKDLDNVLLFAKDDELIFIDDTNLSQIRRLIVEYCSNKIIREVKRGLRSSTVVRYS